ncbi:MAG TPA: 2TM domain-containing protein [Polyangiaceae bacterium]
MPDPDSKRTYSQEEVTEILKRALRQQSLRNQNLSHDELVEMAGEVGIDREALEAATTDLAQTRAEELARQNEARELADERSRLFNKFVSSLLTYVIVNAILYFVDRRFTGGTWYYWVLLGWGIGLLFQLRRLFFPEESLRRRKLREWKHTQKLERRMERQARHRRLREAFEPGVSAERLTQGAKEFETAVQAGVAALLTVAARKIQAHTHGGAGEADGPGGPSRRSQR